MGDFLVFLEKINLHWFRDFCRSFPEERHCILFMPFVTTEIKQNCTYKQQQFTFALSHENTNLLWPPLHQLQQTLGQESQLPKTAQLSLISDLLLSSLPLAKSVTSPVIKTKPKNSNSCRYFLSPLKECSSRHKRNNVSVYNSIFSKWL